MAVIPDLSTAALLALGAFLAALGILVVFLESIRPSRLLGFLIADAALAAALFALAEAGLGLVALAIGAAVVANEAFERLTFR